MDNPITPGLASLSSDHLSQLITDAVDTERQPQLREALALNGLGDEDLRWLESAAKQLIAGHPIPLGDGQSLARLNGDVNGRVLGPVTESRITDGGVPHPTDGDGRRITDSDL